MTTDLFDQRRASRKLIDQSGVWRFREAVLDVDESQIITHPEGGTRLYERDGVFFKHEGENPTGSFKDRGMTVAMTQAVRVDARAGLRLDREHQRLARRARLAHALARASVHPPEHRVAAG